MPLDNVVFWVFAPIAIAAAVGMLVTRSVVYAALFLVLAFCSLAGIYLVLQAEFVGMVQIIVYAGAIMVLFLFVIMLLGVDRIDVRSERLWLQRPIAIVLAVGFVLEVATALRAGIGFATHAPEGFDLLQPAGNAQAVAEVLFRDYFFPFEATSILLIVAAIAAMVLAQRKVRAVTQAELGEDLVEEPEGEAEVEVAP